MAFILLVDVSADLFKTCFGATEEWPCDIRTLSSEDDSDASQLKTMLNDSNLLCVVVENMDTHWNVVKEHYNGGGFVAYFGIYGEFNAPSALSAELGLKWRFSGYTREEYEVTDVGIQQLGDIGGITTQQYTKSNLISAPAEDRIMVGKKYATLKEYLIQCEGIPEEEIFDDPNKMHLDYREDYESAKATGYPRHCETMENQSPLVMHVNENGGKIAYLGFVNGDGNIPMIVRALLAEDTTQGNSDNQDSQPLSTTAYATIPSRSLVVILVSRSFIFHLWRQCSHTIRIWRDNTVQSGINSGSKKTGPSCAWGDIATVCRVQVYEIVSVPLIFVTTERRKFRVG